MSLNKSARTILLTGIIFTILAIGLGAFGAHALEPFLDDYAKEIFKTASQYHFYHALAIICLGILRIVIDLNVKWPFCLFSLGIVCFSGSLYLLSLAEQISISTKILGPITPVGGLLFIGGWIVLFLSLFKKGRRSNT